MTVFTQSVEEQIAQLHQRINGLESGGKPMVQISEQQEQSQAYSPPNVFDFSFSFPNNVSENPWATFYFDVFIDNQRFPDQISNLPDVDIAYIIRNIHHLPSLDTNNNESNTRITIFHNDILYTPTTIRIEGKWVYLSSSSSV